MAPVSINAFAFDVALASVAALQALAEYDPGRLRWPRVAAGHGSEAVCGGGMKAELGVFFRKTGVPLF